MKDLNTIAHILCHYHVRRELDPVEMEILCEWLNESQLNEDFLTDLSNGAYWLQDSHSNELYNLIRSKLTLLYGL